MRVWGAESEGTSQLVIDKRRRIVVAATFTGSEVQDMLEAAAFAVVGELTLERLRHGVAPFPTRSEVWLNLLEVQALRDACSKPTGPRMPFPGRVPHRQTRVGSSTYGSLG
jgi:Pyridine nucleotide-disulphide oxidoreductase, dimerisation domain